MSLPITMLTNNDYVKVYSADILRLDEAHWNVEAIVYKEDIIVDKEQYSDFEQFLNALKKDCAQGYTFCTTYDLSDWTKKFAVNEPKSHEFHKLIGSAMVSTGAVLMSVAVLPGIPIMVPMVAAGILGTYFKATQQLHYNSQSPKLLTVSPFLSIVHIVDILRTTFQVKITPEQVLTWMKANRQKGITWQQIQAVKRNTELEAPKQPTSPSQFMLLNPDSLASSSPTFSTTEKDPLNLKRALLKQALKSNELSKHSAQLLLDDQKTFDEFCQWLYATAPRAHFYAKRDAKFIQEKMQQFLNNHRS